jgi:hypothetical protein
LTVVQINLIALPTRSARQVFNRHPFHSIFVCRENGFIAVRNCFAAQIE